jgi:hypothetical protein
MPGPVSDSYDPEFSTGENARKIAEAVGMMHTKIGEHLQSPPQYIVNVVLGDPGPVSSLELTEQQWRILRFACERALESL